MVDCSVEGTWTCCAAVLVPSAGQTPLIPTSSGRKHKRVAVTLQGDRM